MTVTRLTDHLDRIEIGGFQAYLWCDDDGATLIASGPLGSGPAILDALRARGRTPGDLRRIVLTRSNDAHTGRPCPGRGPSVLVATVNGAVGRRTDARLARVS